MISRTRPQIVWSDKRCLQAANSNRHERWAIVIAALTPIAVGLLAWGLL